MTEHESTAHARVQFRVLEKGAFADADLAAMIELLTLAFERWPLVDPGVPTADHLAWKMSSPGALWAAVLGEADGELVTTDTCIGYRVLLRGREAFRLQFVDHAVRPACRGRGVSSASIAFRQRTLAPHYDLSISDAQSPAMIRRAVKFGTRALGNRIRPLVRALDASEFARRFAIQRGLAVWIGKPLGPLLGLRSGLRRSAGRAARGARPGGEPFQVLPSERFDDRIDAFSAAASAPFDFIVVRSRQHLDWRYGDERGGRFTTRVAEDADGAIVGYAVARARGDRGQLVDLLALPGRLDVVAALIEDLAGALEQAGCIDVVCWLPQRHPYRVELYRSGFFDARHCPHITYRPCGASAEELEFLADPATRIHFTLGDTDLV